jgi:hypothetical protein
MRKTVADLLADLDANLASVNHPFTSASVADRIYEAYTFSLVIVAAVEAGATVRYLQGYGKEVTDIEFRGAPGVIYTADPRWTYAMLRFGRAPELEVHVRVKIVGGRTHTEGECDVLILEQHAADTSRYKNQSPPASKCLAVIECKFYPCTLPVSLGREFAALCTDRGPKVMGYFVSNKYGPMAWRSMAASPSAICEFGMAPGARPVRHFTSLLREAFKRHVCHYDPTHVV